MKFEVGKVYKHTSGQIMHIIGGLQTTLYGGSLVAECSGSANLKPVGQDENAAVNWAESTIEEWMKNFSK